MPMGLGWHDGSPGTKEQVATGADETGRLAIKTANVVLLLVGVHGEWLFCQFGWNLQCP